MGEEKERERNLQRSYPSLQMTCLLIGCLLCVCMCVLAVRAAAVGEAADSRLYSCLCE